MKKKAGSNRPYARRVAIKKIGKNGQKWLQFRKNYLGRILDMVTNRRDKVISPEKE